MTPKRIPYAKRAGYCKNKVAEELYVLMDEKKSNLALSADVTTGKDLLRLAETIGPEICVLKTHIDIIHDFDQALVDELQAIAQKHHFFIFEDRKFADIGHTVQQQYQGGIYRIVNWADIINAHSIPGPQTVAGLAEVGLKKQRGLLLLAEMSSAKNLLTQDYAQKTLAMAEEFSEFVIGFIAMRKLSLNPCWVYMTPGVQLGEDTDQMGQQYVTPERAILERGSDIIIVGRGILKSSDPLAAARQYRAAGWKAHVAGF